MKILITVKSLTDGGAERVASIWANGFITRGHEVIIVNNTNRICSYRINSKIKRYNLSSKLNINLISHIIYIIKLRKVVKDCHPDVIINILNPGAIYDYIATLGLNVPIINTEHNTFERPIYAPLTKFESFCKFRFNSVVSLVTVLTQADKEVIGLKLSNVVVLPNPCTFDAIKEVPTKNKTLLAVGRLDEWKVKGFDVLIKAWSQVSSIYPEWSLKIMGSSFAGGKEYLEDVAHQAGISDSVHFIEYDSNIISMYREAAIFILSSRYEGFGMVLLEAMSQGCACIACDYKGRQREILGDSEYGLICDVDNINMMADQMCTLISNETLRSELQNKAIQRSMDYSEDIIMNKWEKILNKI